MSEDKVEVCKHCRYEYPNEKLGFWRGMVFFIVGTIVFVSIVTFVLLLVKWVIFPIFKFISL